MSETAVLTINLIPELLDCLLQISEKKKVSPSSLAAEILQCCLRKEVCWSPPANTSGSQQVERRRQSLPRYNPVDIVADIQQVLEALGDELPGLNPGDPLAAELEAIISQVEAERKND